MRDYGLRQEEVKLDDLTGALLYFSLFKVNVFCSL